MENKIPTRIREVSEGISKELNISVGSPDDESSLDSKMMSLLISSFPEVESAIYRNATLGKTMEALTKIVTVDEGSTSINEYAPGVLRGLERTSVPSSKNSIVEL